MNSEPRFSMIQQLVAPPSTIIMVSSGPASAKLSPIITPPPPCSTVGMRDFCSGQTSLLCSHLSVKHYSRSFAVCSDVVLFANLSRASVFFFRQKRLSHGDLSKLSALLLTAIILNTSSVRPEGSGDAASGFVCLTLA